MLMFKKVFFFITLVIILVACKSENEEDYLGIKKK